MKRSKYSMVAVACGVALAASAVLAQGDDLGYKAPDDAGVAASPGTASSRPRSAQEELDQTTADLARTTVEIAERSAAREVAQYGRASVSPSAQQAQLQSILRGYHASHMGAESAVQASQAANEATVDLLALQSAQNQRIIEQNNRTIALLEQIAKKPK